MTAGSVAHSAGILFVPHATSAPSEPGDATWSEDSQTRRTQEHVGLEAAEIPAAQTPLDPVELDDLWRLFAETYPRKAGVVELKFFGGLETREIATVLQTSEKTVQRDGASPNSGCTINSRRRPRKYPEEKCPLPAGFDAGPAKAERAAFPLFPGQTTGKPNASPTWATRGQSSA